MSSLNINMMWLGIWGFRPKELSLTDGLMDLVQMEDG